MADSMESTLISKRLLSTKLWETLREGAIPEIELIIKASTIDGRRKGAWWHLCAQVMSWLEFELKSRF